MENNNANDGVPGVTQCESFFLLNIYTRLLTSGPIPPGGSFTYRFRATSYGNTWYHSHFSLQYPDGLVGPIVINGPSSANWDIDLGPLSITDWFHTPASELFFSEEQPGPPAAGDTGLIQGKNMFNGAGEYFDMKFTQGKKHRIRLVNTSTNTHFKFSIDSHTMTVLSVNLYTNEGHGC
jgi:FtsP/CotA-like multicopper oxidase with cupredoxin domain